MGLSSLITCSSLFPALLVASLLVPSPSSRDRTTEQGEAQVTSATEECTSYYYAPASEAFAADQLPPIWTPATILANDIDAIAKYQSIQSQIPNIPPNGNQPQSITGNFTGFSYPSSDPSCWWTYDKCTTPKIPGLPPDVVAVPEPDTLGYGFDDGPSCSHNVFYDYLQQNDQKATLFYIGSNIADWPLEAQRGLADGHEICVHTWSHNYMTALTNKEVFAELYYAMKIIKLVIGVTPTCWRPPYGDVDDRVRSIAHALGLRNIVWTYDSDDWQGTDYTVDAQVDANYEALIASAYNGAFSTGGTIMLTHELGNYTMSEAIKFYDQLKAVFKYLVPVGVATNQTRPYVETNYSLPNFEQYIAGTTILTDGVASQTGWSATSTSTLGSSATASFGTGASGRSGSGTSGARRSFEAWGGLAVLTAFVGSMLRLLV